MDGTKGFSNAGTWMKVPGNAADWVKNKWNGTKEFSVDFGIQQRRLKNTWENIKQSAADSAKSVGERALIM